MDRLLSLRPRFAASSSSDSESELAADCVLEDEDEPSEPILRKDMAAVGIQSALV